MEISAAKMTGRIRRAIYEKIKDVAHLQNIYAELEVPNKRLLNEVGRPTLIWTIPTNVAQQQTEILRALKSVNFNVDYVENVQAKPAEGKKPATIEFQLRPDIFAAHILKPQTALQSNIQPNTESVVVEFSSPNIAKPFHVGHLRSTIIGNALANLHQHLGYTTIKLNYLGDWGTQFGMLALGVNMTGVSDAEIRAKPIENLYKAYVHSNKAAEKDVTISERARALFSKLEANADPALAEQWEQYRQYTIVELSQVYSRLGVCFDHYDWESQYSQGEIATVLERLRAAGILLKEHDGREIVCVGQRRVPIIKSDGSTLYLARDIAALLERYERFKFSRMLYIVENGQTDHFKALFSTATALMSKELPIKKLVHVKFGRIHGMSTRQGKAVFLKDVLNEACDIMREKRKNSATTKTNKTMDDEHVCDVLGVSAVVINDLKQRRQRDYDFNWQQALQMNGDTGIKLQYTHCRLHSLLTRFEHYEMSAITPNWQLLAEPDAQDLLYEIARFEQTVWQAKIHLEACVLVNYLFSLCNSTSRALKRLPVKQEVSIAKQQQRLLLFHAAQRTLKQGMKILGLQPLNQM